MEKTHWKKEFSYDYLGSYSLDNGEVTLTMAGTKKMDVIGASGRKESAFVTYFKEKADWIKPMILNRTNCKTIEKMYGTPFIEDWTGKAITIYVEPGVKAFGEVVDALRIRKDKPKPPVMVKDSDTWKSAVDYLKTGGELEKIKAKYTISTDLLTELKAIQPNG